MDSSHQNKKLKIQITESTQDEKFMDIILHG